MEQILKIQEMVSLILEEEAVHLEAQSQVVQEDLVS
jgi:hypothetical protein